MKRSVGTVLVVVLVVLAGCNGVFGGGGGGGESTPMVTPMAVPTDEPTPTPVAQLAPGLTGEGIENASALVAAHTSFLQNTSFTIRSNRTEVVTNGSVVVRRTESITRARAGPVGEGIYLVSKHEGEYRRRSGPLVVRNEQWSRGDRGFQKYVYSNGTVRYRRVPVDVKLFRRSFARVFYLDRFGTANTTVVERFIRNGTTLYRVRGSVSGENQEIRLRLLVDSRGVVHRLRIVRKRVVEKRTLTSVFETRLSKIGTTDAPERPSWVDEAINRTAPAPSIAPGLTKDGIRNASALVAAHTSTLQNTSFTKLANTTRLAANGSVVFRRTSTARVGSPGEGLYSVTEINDSYVPSDRTVLFRIERWSDGERVLVKRTDANGSTTYDRRPIAVARLRRNVARANLRYHLERFQQSNTAVTDRFTANGTTLYVVNGTARAGRRNATIRLVVDSRGVVHKYRISREMPFDPNATRAFTKTRFVGVNATDTSERPTWIDEALNRTTPVVTPTVTPSAMTATPNATTATATNRTETASTTADTTTRQ